VQVVQHFTELGLRINSARISSDGGWFHDVFLVTEVQGGKVRNPKKIQSIKQMLNVYMRDEDVVVNGDDTDDAERVETTVFELSGMDRAGLLSEVMQLLTLNGCDVRSAAVWTYKGRVAFIFSVTEKGKPVVDVMKLQRLRQMVADIITTPGGLWTVRAHQRVRGEVHHERRLHQLMLQDERNEVERSQAEMSIADVDSSPNPPSDPDLQTNDLDASSVAMGVRGSPLRSPKFDRPFIDISHCAHPDYWTVNIRCRDRTKLLFDTVCTLADMEYDIYHATIDSDAEGWAHQEYFLKPRSGDGEFDPRAATLLKAMLEGSIERRFPKGMKVHVKSMDRFGCLAALAKQLHQANITVTRAKVRTFATSNSCGHTLYVMDAAGGPPDRAQVQHALLHCGGKPAQGGEMADGKIPVRGSHKFSFTFTERHYGGLGGSPTDSFCGSL
jgi:UTP:GlnB (protein PII) uridylyltransferase